MNDHGVRCVSSSKLPLCNEGDESVISNPLVIRPPSSFDGKALTVEGDVDITGVIDPTSIIFTEQSTAPQTPTSTEGAIWVRSDNPTSLMYTNSGGSNIVLSSNGSTTISCFTSSDTFTVPAGVTAVTAICQGGGGGGGGGFVGTAGNAGSGGGGGGSGAYTTIYFSVTPDEELNIIVGLGGGGGNESTAGDDGDDSSIDRDGTVLAIARGGGGGGTSSPGGIGGVGGYGGWGGGAGGSAALTSPSAGGRGIYVKGDNSGDAREGGIGAPGNIVGYPPIQGGDRGDGGAQSGGGGGGGAPALVPELSIINLTGSAGSGGDGVGASTNGENGGDATRRGAGGGGGSGGGVDAGGTNGGLGGSGNDGYVVLFY
jgi:hypothetical protein